MAQQQRDIKRKLAVLQHAHESGNVALTARRFGTLRQCYHRSKRAYEEHGESRWTLSLRHQPSTTRTGRHNVAPFSRRLVQLSRDHGVKMPAGTPRPVTLSHPT